MIPHTSDPHDSARSPHAEDRSVRQTLLRRGISIISVLGMLSSGAAWTQTADVAPAPVPVAPAPTPSEPAVEPSVSVDAPVLNEIPKESSAPIVEAPASAPTADATELYIDSTRYDLGATQRSTDQPAMPRPALSIPAASTAAVPTAPTSVSIGPLTVSSSGLGIGQTTPSARNYYNRTIRPPALLGNGNVRLMFPLAIPAPITSVFGWRVHPVTGDSRFHSGTDLGAPMGTPVLAAVAGRVAIADFLGGYGLAVTLNHSKDTQQTLYGHLSEIFVKPGEWVEQGAAIGRVGSTGMSTGPHLHFEFHQLTAGGWVALDAGAQLEYALAQLMTGLQFAQSTPGSVIGSFNGGVA
ncbi:peptidoglycan DD-metalloendopeptidase family protein, partial [Leptolyngbya sp. FACHB-36]|uniref:M23 family metallopeptidase n=1 Tax=Leptolyngbya sp. FACHB-36 TaxID=2692808 RepID=UPI0016801679